jgi:SpoVK/Ycf46/Vps4 family AAA+-type ATPase
MQNKKTWQLSNNCYYLQDISSTQDKLENAIYSLEVNPMGILFLERKEEKFIFDFKIYGLEEDFIARVLRSYTSTTGNMGVLLNGKKGTGKTVTGEILANRLDQPIILIHTPI